MGTGQFLAAATRTEIVVEDEEGCTRQVEAETTMQDDAGYILRKTEDAEDEIDYLTGQRTLQSTHHNVKTDYLTGEVVHDATILVDSVEENNERKETRTFRVQNGQDIDDGISTITERRDPITGEVTIEDHCPDPAGWRRSSLN